MRDVQSWESKGKSSSLLWLFMIDSTETNSSDKVVKNLHGHCHCKYSTARESWCGLQLIRAVQETFWEEITGVKRAHVVSILMVFYLCLAHLIFLHSSPLFSPFTHLHTCYLTNTSSLRGWQVLQAQVTCPRTHSKLTEMDICCQLLKVSYVSGVVQIVH